MVFEDGYKDAVNGEVVIDDRYLNTENLQASNSNQNPEETIKAISDLSEITTRYDSFGNKTEARYFKNHPRLSLVLLETAANGRQRVYVYGYGKEVKTLPGEMSKKVLTASGDEIANAAGLNEMRSNTEVKNFKKQSKPVQPLPSADLPVQPPQNLQSQPEADEQNTEPKVEENVENPANSEAAAARNKQTEVEDQR